MSPTRHRQCKRCQRWRPLSEFSGRSALLSQWQRKTYCRACQAAVRRERRAAVRAHPSHTSEI